jgi:hypothetical protein
MNKSKKQLEYEQEFEKYQFVPLSLGLYEQEGIKKEIIYIGTEFATVKTVSSGKEHQKTLHWCRKYLTKSNS